MTIQHEPIAIDNPTMTEDELYDKAQKISETFVGYHAADAMGILSILVRFAFDKHIKPDRRLAAFENFRAWVFGELD